MMEREQHGFTITIEVVESGPYEDAFNAAFDTATGIWDRLPAEAEIVVRATGHSTFQGIPNGVYCEGCVGHTIPGIRWPTASNSDSSREWVERCDICARYTDDEAAADRVVEEYAGVTKYKRGTAKPAGSEREQPYVNVTTLEG